MTHELIAFSRVILHVQEVVRDPEEAGTKEGLGPFWVSKSPSGLWKHRAFVWKGIVESEDKII